MLFNSPEFIFIFLPAVFLVFTALGRLKEKKIAAAWLVISSLGFYAWWNPTYVLLLVASIGSNYMAGRVLMRLKQSEGSRLTKPVLVLSVAANLALLCYYKYANFFLETLNHASGADWTLGTLILPLGISFYTFTQIAYLVDVYQGKVREYNLIHYALFVTYFPHLVAGPILHHGEMMPQFADTRVYRVNSHDIAIGLTIFSIGLFKKVILADSIAPYANLTFGAASQGTSLGLVEAWGGALAYTLQLYFDFSGYSDMAIGISRLFGIVLPINFHSPYKAVNITDFWRRWHMTLSRFLRDYLYVPLGGNRKGPARRYLNLAITMLLGGLWHGAAWTFVVWGGLHGLFLIAHQAWAAFWRRFPIALPRPLNLVTRLSAQLLTFVAVVVGWVFFRADSVDSALRVLEGMAGLHGCILPAGWLERMGIAGQWLRSLGVSSADIADSFGGRAHIGWIAGLLAVAWFLPNTQEIMGRIGLGLAPYTGASRIAEIWLWKPDMKWLCLSSCLAIWSVLNLNRITDFLYWQF